MVAAQNQLVDLHTAWTEQQLTDGVHFDPEEHPEDSDYNQHHVELEADGEALDDLAVASALVLGQRPPLDEAEPVQASADDDLDEEFDTEAADHPDEEQRARALARLAEVDQDGPDLVEAAAGKDVTPGRDQLHHYWTRSAEGLARWVTSPHPWSTLVALLSEHVSPAKARVFASKWFKEVFGIWSGERKGKNPLGPG